MLGRKDKPEKIDTMNGVNVPLDGLVHSVIIAGGLAAGGDSNIINRQLVELQSLGAAIISVTPYVVKDNTYALCIFRSPIAK